MSAFDGPPPATDPDDPGAPVEPDPAAPRRALVRVVRLEARSRGECDGCGVRRLLVASLEVNFDDRNFCTSCGEKIAREMWEALRK